MEIRRYLPSKRFSVFVFSILVAGGIIGGAVIVGRGKPLSSALDVFSTLSVGSGSSVGQGDRDQDGLKDWEESVRGTDPDKSDTDGDGTSDGDEIKLLRDPKKPGPDDSLVNAADQKFILELLAQASSTNLTDDLSQTIFARYVEARGKGASGDLQAQAAVVEEAITNAEVSYRGDPYTMEELTVVADSPAATRTFANGSMRAILNHPDASFMLAMQAFNRGMEGRGGAEKELRAIGYEYRLVAAEMAAVPVPQPYAKNYMLAINSFEIAGGAFDDMAHIGDDPIRAVVGLQNYNNMIGGGANIFIMLAHDLARAGLIFSAQEPGRSWAEFMMIANSGSPS